MAIKLSQLQRETMGTVAANKQLNSMDIQVTLDEQQPFQSGEITDQVSTYSGGGTNAQGQTYQDNLQQTLTVTATWVDMHGGGNRISAPDVRRGERVQLYRFADSVKYYWSPANGPGFESKRALETVTYGINASPKDGATGADNMYMLQVSAHTKQITLATSAANGEKTTYNVQIDTGNGVINIIDGEGNSFTFDSIAAVIRMLNNQGALYEVNGPDVNIYAPNGNLHMVAKTAKFEFATSWDIYSQATTHNGNFTENGAFALGGDMTTATGGGGGVGTPGTGQITIAGEATLKGDLTVTQNLTVNQTISTPNPISAPNIP